MNGQEEAKRNKIAKNTLMTDRVQDVSRRHIYSGEEEELELKARLCWGD